MKKVFIQVPATSANCGPGFDTLGLACNLYNEVSYEITDKKGFQLEVEGEGADYLKPFGRNLAFASFLRVWNAVTDGQRRCTAASPSAIWSRRRRILCVCCLPSH